MAPKPGASRQMLRACSHPVSESGQLQVHSLPVTLLCYISTSRTPGVGLTLAYPPH